MGVAVQTRFKIVSCILCSLRAAFSGHFQVVYLVQHESCVDISNIGSVDSEKMLLVWGQHHSICDRAVLMSNATRMQGWNRLYSEMLIRYYTNATPAQHPFTYVVLVEGLSQMDIPASVSSKASSPEHRWHLFEEFLSSYGPAIGTPVTSINYVQTGVSVVERVNFVLDLVLAIHVQATPLLLPFSERFEDDYALAIQNALACTVFKASIVHFNTLQLTSSPSRFAAGRESHDILASEWIESALSIPGQKRFRLVSELGGAAPETLLAPIAVSERFRLQPYTAAEIASDFDPCHPYFLERSQFYREVRHHAPHSPEALFYLTAEEYAAAPDCRDLLAEDDGTAAPPLPVSCNMSDLFRNPGRLAGRVRWRRDAAAEGRAEWRVEVDGCHLGDFDAATARRCIARASPRGVMLIGDSVTRYLYLNLAHFLATGDWASPPDLPNENEKRFGNWTRFLQACPETRARLCALCGVRDRRRSCHRCNACTFAGCRMIASRAASSRLTA